MSDREESPDWLRSFQPPPQSAIFLSSGSESPLSPSTVSDDEDGIKLSKLFNKDITKVSNIKDIDNEDGKESEINKTLGGKSLEKRKEIKLTPGRKRKNKDITEKKGKITEGKAANRKTPEKRGQPHEHSVFALSSDSESSLDARPAKKDRVTKKELLSNNDDQVFDNSTNVDEIVVDRDGESPKIKASKMKSHQKKLNKEDGRTSKEITDNDINGDDPDDNSNKAVVKEDISGIHVGRQVSSSRLPLLMSEKVQYSKALVECEGDSIDLSGDVGAVGRIVISDDHSKNHDMLLDLKGTIYRTTIVPSRTFCVVSFGQSEAKIDAIMNDYIQLKSQSNVYEAETMVEGTLDGFSFDSEDEADNLPKATVQGDQEEAAEEQIAGKGKRRVQKTAGGGRNKGKAVGGKGAKKVKKKPQVPKKGKNKK